jgi:hypothetical protein
MKDKILKDDGVHRVLLPKFEDTKWVIKSVNRRRKDITMATKGQKDKQRATKYYTEKQRLSTTKSHRYRERERGREGTEIERSRERGQVYVCERESSSGLRVGRIQISYSL